jgi:beta propeller repeat protein
MRRRLGSLLVLALIAVLPASQAAQAQPSQPIDNEEQRVTDHGFRTGAPQDRPDISNSFIVWRDNRGDSDQVSTEPFGHIWSKDLATRDEAPVKTSLATDDANPRVSGTWAVWTDHTPESSPGAGDSNDDIYACQLPCTGSPIRVTTNPAHQMNPAIDGTTVVWEDYRNGSSNIDIFKKDLPAGAEQPVVVAPGNQVSPSISANRVAWREDPNTGDAVDESDVYIKVGNNPPVKVTDAEGRARSLSEYQVAVSGNRVLWNEKDPACVPGEEDPSNCRVPRILKTCSFGSIGCGAISTVDRVPTDSQFGMITDLDQSGSRGVWAKQTEQVSGSHAYTRDPVTSGPIVPVDDVELGFVAGVRVDGQRFAWTQAPGDVPLSDTDIFWRDAATQPRRANSISLGSFGEHGLPAADGDLVVYRRDPIEVEGTSDITGGTEIWATDLSGPRRHFAVSTVFGTGNSRPAIVGERIVWGDCVAFNFNSCGPIFQRDLADPEPAVTDLSQLGPPDADGSSTAWRCGDSEICVHDGNSMESFDISAFLFDSDPGTEPFSVVSLLVRLSGSRVVWHEFVVDPSLPCPPDEDCGPEHARLHVLDVGTGPPEDRVIGEGTEVVGGSGDFDISGSNVVWASESDTLRRADVQDPSCTGPETCPQVLVTHADHQLFSPSIDGDRVAWLGLENLGGDCCGEQDVYTKELSEQDPGTFHLVTNESTAFVDSPFVDGDRIYWKDGRCGGFLCSDIFMESATGAPLPAPDTIPPGPPKDFVAVPFGNGVELLWKNPTSNDFYRVRILRKSGLVPPSGLDDPSASVVYEGSGAALTDTDVELGRKYSYLMVAFDLEPNFSTPVTATT